ncbi:MAG: response regulator [gamma proteobacterium symbiont of Taylorina sp.]|nr:response regulator [gamma proteobacterium symbiont of Taylorina sp.]
MKQNNIERRLPFYYWLVILTCIALVFFFFIQSQSNNNSELKKISSGITELINLNSQLSDALVQNYSGLINHYDELVDSFDLLERKSGEFIYNTKLLNYTELELLWQDYQQALSSKQQSLEHYKSHYAILKNSQAYFFLVSYQLEAYITKIPDRTDLEIIFHFINHVNKAIIFHLKINPENIIKVEQLSKQFPQDAEISILLENLFTHTNIIMALQAEVNEMISLTHRTKTKELLDEIFQQYLRIYEQEDQKAVYYKMAMLIVAIFLALAILFSFYRQNKILNKLSDTIDALDFQQFALNQHAIVSETDVRGDITYVNDKFCKISGYSEQELIGKNHRIIKSDEHSDSIFKNLWRTIANGRVWHGQVKNRAKNGRYYWVNATIVPFLNKKGKPFRYISIRTDITQQKDNEAQLAEKNQFMLEDISIRKETEQALQLARQKAEEHSRQKSDFLSNMSHELRTPMNAIIGLSYLTLETDLNELQHNYIEKIYSSSKVLLDLINDILDVSKIEAGKLNIEKVEFKIETIIKQLFHVTQIKAVEKDLTLHYYLCPAIPKVLIGDSLRITQVLTNLIYNAIKFTPSGHIMVNITQLEQTQSDTNPEQIYLKFEVCDTGIGLSRKQQEKLFSAFTQADTSTTREYGGTGLGLSISKNLVTLMQGEIGVFSKKGEGSQFYFTLPLILTDAKSSANEISPEGQYLKNIFIIDDSKIHNQLIQRMLETLGIQYQSFDRSISTANLAQIISDKTEIICIINSHTLLDNAKLLLQLKQLHENKVPFSLILTAYDITRINLPELAYQSVVVLDDPLLPSSFIKSLLQKQSSAKDELAKKDKVSKKRVKADFNQAQILLVEDNKVNQMVASALLKRFNLDISIANNGQEAVELFASQSRDNKHYQIIFMDIQMPVMDGIEATKAIRQDQVNHGNNIPIVALTAHALAEERERCVSAGMNAHLTKPIDPDALLSALTQYLDH